MDTDNPRAFARSSGSGNHAQDGMTLRDYFAAKAMAALVGNEATVAYARGCFRELPADERVNRCDASIAESAYRIADALLAERQKAGA